MSRSDRKLKKRVEKHEAGVSDLIAAYELAEQHYFAAVSASTPSVVERVASNSSAGSPDVNLG